MGRFLHGAQVVASDKNTSGNAAEYTIQAPFERFNLGYSHTQLNQFSSEQFNSDPTVDQVVRLNKFRGNASLSSLLGLQLSAEAVQSQFQVGRDTWTGLQRTAIQTWDLHWFNTLIYDRGASPQISGELANLYLSSNWEMRTGLFYRRSAESANLNLLKRFDKTHSVNFSVQNQFTDKVFNYGVGWSRAECAWPRFLRGSFWPRFAQL
jgi:hypothetical protein